MGFGALATLITNLGKSIYGGFSWLYSRGETAVAKEHEQATKHIVRLYAKMLKLDSNPVVHLDEVLRLKREIVALYFTTSDRELQIKYDDVHYDSLPGLSTIRAGVRYPYENFDTMIRNSVHSTKERCDEVDEYKRKLGDLEEFCAVETLRDLHK